MPLIIPSPDESIFAFRRVVAPLMRDMRKLKSFKDKCIAYGKIYHMVCTEMQSGSTFPPVYGK